MSTGFDSPKVVDNALRFKPMVSRQSSHLGPGSIWKKLRNRVKAQVRKCMQFGTS